MSIVAVKKCKSYDFEEVYEAIKETIESAGGIEYMKGKIVLLKPNLLAPSKPEDSVTTHPIVVKAIIRYLYKVIEVKQVQVGDSPGVGTQQIIYNSTGIKKVIEEEGAIIANFNEKIEVKNPEGKIVKSFILAKAFSDADYIISVPKLKTHAMTYYTGAVKNLFGMVPGLLKPKFHYQFPDKQMFAEMLVDLNIVLKPAFAVMDGIVAMEGNGPRSGESRAVELILASKDLPALDSVACSIVGINPFDILPLLKSQERGYGEINIDKIEIRGNQLEDFNIKNFKQIKQESGILKILPVSNKVSNAIRELVIPKPKFFHDKCVMCRECIEVCPVEPKALTEENGKIKIDRKKCIRCFCCQEMCPAKAIEAKITLF